jgi:PKD repeat protein
MPTLKDVAQLLGLQSERAMAAKLGLKAPVSTLALIRKYEQLPPKARFSVTPNYGTMPLAVLFNDQSLGYITKREWDFGNGEKSGDANPPHTYRAPEEVYGGSDFHLVDCAPWNPTLTVSNKSGSDTATATVTVYPAPPAAKFSADKTSGSAPLTVGFAVERAAGYCLTHRWNFGDPNSGAKNTATTSGQSGPLHQYNTPGSYDVVLEISNSAGVAFGGGTIVVTGGSAPGPGPGKDAPYITAGRVPNASTISVGGNKFSKSAAVTINVTKDSDHTNLAKVDVFTDANGVFENQLVNVPSCAGTGYSSFEIDIQATDAAGTVSNTVKIACYTSDTP